MLNVQSQKSFSKYKYILLEIISALTYGKFGDFYDKYLIMVFD